MRSAIDVKLSSISGSNRLPSSSSACVMRSLSTMFAIVCHLNLCRNQDYQDHRACQTIRELRARPDADSAISIQLLNTFKSFAGRQTTSIRYAYRGIVASATRAVYGVRIGLWLEKG